MTAKLRAAGSRGAIFLLLIAAMTIAVRSFAAAATAGDGGGPAAAPLRVRSQSLAAYPTPNVPRLSGTQGDKESSLFNPELQDISAAAQYMTQAELEMKPCVVVRFYDKQANALPLLLFSLFASAHPHLKALVIDTGKEPYKKLPDLLRQVNRASGKTWVYAYDKKRKDVRAAFPDFHYDDFGYVLTDMALGDILRQTKKGFGRNSFQCDTLTFTNADNLYSPHFIPAMLKSITHDGHDLVASHFVSHYKYSAERSTLSYDNVMSSEIGCGTLRSGEDAEFVTSERFLPCCVELGSVMVTTSAVADAKIRFVLDKLLEDGTGNSLKKKSFQLPRLVLSRSAT